VARQFAWCVREGDRIDVVAWLTEHQLVGRVNQAEGRSTNSQGRSYFIAPVVLISDELGWEYPNSADQLAEGLAQAGYSREHLLADLALAGQANQILRSRSTTPEADVDPVVVLVGTPSRRVAGTKRLAHLVAWKLDRFGEEIVKLLAEDAFGGFTQKGSERLRGFAREWLHTSVVRWMVVFDQRAETTQRRDQDTSISWLFKKRVLVLGCGALGAPVAEHCVRAGAAAVTVVDNGVVTPGILVRQPYRDCDIGKFKANVLADRLNAITRKPRVRGVKDDAIGFVLNELDATDFDLIVDATANSGVRAAIERAHRDHVVAKSSLPHTAMMIIGHKSEIGLVTISRSGATGTGHDVLRRVLLSGRRTGTRAWREALADFFPDPPRTDVFLPEPGCSAPTFVGSAADVAALAASMFIEMTRILTVGNDNEETMTAVAVHRQNGTAQPLWWPNDLVLTDGDTQYEVRLSAEAMAEIRTEARRGARVRGPRVETGGMLLGAIDESTGVISIDLATGPAPDSKLSHSYFFQGTAGTQELIEHHALQTGGATGFLGIWHTHPGGPARPSQMDLEGMAALTSFTPYSHRALMVIIGGAPAQWNNWVAAGGRPDVCVKVIERDLCTVDPNTRSSADQQEVPFSQYFPGGFSSSAPESIPRRRRWFWRRKR
jgi:molybdopterin/thiamine biosynthesis adenylyltransferase/proteasome lid subunit RPN8/RPN11